MPESETKIVFYNSQHKMQKGIESMQKNGWEVLHTEVIKGNYEMGKTCCLGCLFLLPLALLGRGSDKYKVQYRRKGK